MATSKKTNKTAHVLNMLSRGPTDSTTSQVSEPSAHTNTVSTSAPVLANLPALDINLPDDLQLSETIRENLLLEIEKGEDEIEVSPHQHNTSSAQHMKFTEQEACSKNDESSEMQLNDASKSVDSEVSVDTSDTVLHGEYIYKNIVETLVDERVDQYMDMLDVCRCTRCKADVKAIALTNLQPKYLVMSRGDSVKMLSIYEKQFSSDITVQIISACQKVIACPNH